MNTIALLLQASGNSTAAFLIQVLPIAAIFLVFYFLVIGPAVLVGPYVVVKGGLGTKPAIAVPRVSCAGTSRYELTMNR